MYLLIGERCEIEPWRTKIWLGMTSCGNNFAIVLRRQFAALESVLIRRLRHGSDMMSQLLWQWFTWQLSPGCSSESASGEIMVI
jgi:hypothetical protein